jgi:hypothetical protein
MNLKTAVRPLSCVALCFSLWCTSIGTRSYGTRRRTGARISCVYRMPSLSAILTNSAKACARILRMIWK